MTEELSVILKYTMCSVPGGLSRETTLGQDGPGNRDRHTVFQLA